MQAGNRIAQFELLEVIGRGGMGEVWRAHDTRLERDVAMKTLPARFAADAACIARLTREAKTLATLNHPNIGAILGLEEQEGQYWLVLELVEGPTLEDRLATGRLALHEATAIGLQVAEALQAAHSRGIVHCDLKPSNIKLSADGRVKVLDFGIARSLRAPPQTQQTTLTVPPTTEISGTPVYMSPEQARGEQVGPTSDIWAFGVLMYRMLAGRLPFVGPTAADTVAQVLQATPDLALLRPQVPEALVRVLRHCLEKEPRLRVQHAGDLRILIEQALVPVERAGEKETAAARRWLMAGAAVVVLAALLALFWFQVIHDGTQQRAAPVRAELTFESAAGRSFPVRFRRIAIARDGSRIAVASDALWIRSLGTARPVKIDTNCRNPFFSPDGAWVGCFSDTSLVKVPAGGGAAVPIAQITERSAGAVWGNNGSILFATSEGLFRVDEAGGKPELIVRPDAAHGDRQFAWPELLPGERAALLTVLSREQDVPPRLVRLDLDRKTFGEVLKGGSSPRYLSDGILLYASGTRLLAVRWDARPGAVAREPLPVPDVLVDASDNNGTANYAVSANGTLVTLRGTPDASRGRVLFWRDVHGVDTPVEVPAGNYGYPRVSPDGKRVALDIAGSDNRDIWILDLERRSLARMTNDVAEDNLPVWSSDGRRVFFTSNRGGDFDIYSQAADASDVARKEVTAPGPQMVLGISPDGRYILAVEEFRRLSVFDTGSGALKPLLREGAVYWCGAISPDGKWIAYESNESGERVEIFVRPFPAVAGRRERISLSGGRYPVWGPAGSNALYFLQPDGAMMRAQLRLDAGLQLGAVTRLFDWVAPGAGISGTPYDVSRLDGRFLLSRPVATETGGVVQAELVLNWFDELRRLVPE